MLFEIIFLSIGILLIVLAVANIFRNMRLKREGILVRATVVDIHRTKRASKHTSYTQYHPVFEYPVDGKSVKTRGPGSAKVDYSVGMVTEIRYDPRRPERILVGESLARGHIPPILIGMAFIVGSVLSMLGVKLPSLGASAGYLVFTGMLLFFVLLIVVIVKSLRGTKNKFAQSILSEQTANNVLVAAKNEDCTITFEFVNGNRINYLVPESTYKDLREGEWGKLTFQGSLFLRFEKTYR